jgi:hypothetical protein
MAENHQRRWFAATAPAVCRFILKKLYAAWSGNPGASACAGNWSNPFMSHTSRSGIRVFVYTIVSALAVSAAAAAQDAPRGWRRVDDSSKTQAAERPAPISWQDQDQAPDQNTRPGPPVYQPDGGGAPPAHLIIRAGTYLTVRINQPLSSDRNQSGDAFSASLARPLVVDGIVVAQTGQTVGGRVVEAQKAGRVNGVSRLKVQLTDLTLVDGQQLPIQSQMVTRNGPTTEGRDAGAIASTTATGAVIGAAADWGRGAAIGAGAGAAAGIIGVLLTRGAPTVLFPEAVLTFRIEAPVTVSTERAPQTFRYVEPADYDRATYQAQAGPPMRHAPGPPPPPPYYFGGYYYPYPYPYWGGSFGVFWGPRFYRGGFYYRGFHR